MSVICSACGCMVSEPHTAKDCLENMERLSKKARSEVKFANEWVA